MAMLATQRWFPWLCLGLLSLCATGCPSPMASQPASPPTSQPLRPAPAPSEVPPHLPDLGDVAQGTYTGDVIADSHGASKSHVTVTVTRIGSNLVRITSDDARLPTVDVPLTSAMDKIVQAQGNTVFLLDRFQRPARLDVSFLNEVSWAGTKQ